ncbi:ABC transporter permease [bacterium]|nr:ABC transporter permease [bacterium]
MQIFAPSFLYKRERRVGVCVVCFLLGWLPPGLWESLWSGPEYWILPTITLSLRPMALLVRQVRGSLLESLEHDYIRTARAKGLGEHTIIWKHALRNAWIPVLGLLPPIAAQLLTGSFLVETVFQIPGLGRSFVSSVVNRDYGLIMGTTLTFGLFLAVFTLAGDLLLTWADPRLRHQGDER